MARVPTIEKRTDVPAGGEAAWDRIAESRKSVVGPFTVLLHSPELAARTAHLGAYVRFESALDPPVRELVILAVARQMDCRFEWAAHVPLARQAGVREDAIAAIRDRRIPAGLTAGEAPIVLYVTQLLGAHRVDEATFAAVRERLGVPGTVELTATAGYYAMIACALNAFDLTPDAAAEPLPP